MRRCTGGLVVIALLFLFGLVVAPDLGAQAGKDKKALTFEVYKDSGGDYRWRLLTGEDVNIGMAPKGYKAKADCMKAIEAIKEGAAKAKVVEEKAK